MFVLFGTKTVKRPVRDGLHIEKHCPKCRRTREMQEFQWQKFFSLYFIPLFPIEKGENALKFLACDSSYDIQLEDYRTTAGRHPSGGRAESSSEPEKIVIKCLQCAGKIRIPNLGKPIRVTCSHCGHKFEVRPRYINTS